MDIYWVVINDFVMAMLFIAGTLSAFVYKKKLHGFLHGLICEVSLGSINLKFPILLE